MPKITDGSIRLLTASTPLLDADTMLVARDALVERTSGATLRDWYTDTAWITITLLNSWVNFDVATYGTAQYRRLGDMVYTRGLIKSGTAQPMFTLPAGFRPPAALMLHARAWNASTSAIRRVDVGIDGSATRADGDATWNGYLAINFKWSVTP